MAKNDRCLITGTPTIAKIRACARKCARKKNRADWFEPGAMRFFNTRIERQAFTDGHGGAFFVTKERPDNRAPWKWSIRHYNPNKCKIDTVGKFQRFRSSSSAIKAAKNMSRRGRISTQAPRF